MKDIGFVGLGVMGAPMAAHLLQAGFAVRVWNRTAEKAEALLAQGARRATTPAEAAAGAEAIITMVADDEALRHVVHGSDGILYSLSAGGVHLTMGTVSPQLLRQLTHEHRECGTHLLAAPVFGSKESAVGKKLWAVVGGQAAAFERCRPVIEAMCAGGTYLGEDPGAAAQMKLIINMLISTAVAALVQAFTLGRAGGLAADKLTEVVRRVFASPLYERYGTRLEKRDFDVYFPLKLMLKDLRLVLEMAAAAGVPLPHAAATREMVVAAIGRGFADADAAASLLRTWEATG
jgi:3-hydroxyisobutyrate dehydrogenase-like beta-hydroxyacid dehydrogenase